MKSILFFVALILCTVTHAADLPRVAVTPDSLEQSVLPSRISMKCNESQPQARLSIISGNNP